MGLGTLVQEKTMLTENKQCRQPTLSGRRGGKTFDSSSQTNRQASLDSSRMQQQNKFHRFISEYLMRLRFFLLAESLRDESRKVFDDQLALLANSIADCIIGKRNYQHTKI